jgi:hypothetical protein
MLPSKKILILIVLVILGIGALAWYGYSHGLSINYNSTSDQNLLSIASSSISKTISQIDNDQDGLPDWEEALYGTNPRNSDTDSDGTTDGQEVLLGRNPLVKGPKDFIASKSSAATTSITAAPEELTATDVFARDFFAQYMKLNQSGVKVTSDNADQIASNYLKSAPLPNVAAKKYVVNDLKITNSSATDLLNYQNAITAVFTKYWPTEDTDEFGILYETFSKDNPATLSKLSETIAIYKNALDNTLALSVPQTVVTEHLAVVNALSVYIETLKMIQLAYTDPISSLAGLKVFTTNNTNLTTSMANLRIYLINSIKQ